MAAEAKASTSCAGGGWGKMAAIRENEEKSVWAAITRGAEGCTRLERREIGGERKRGHGPRKVWWRWVKKLFELCLSAETSPKIQGGTERLTINERRVPELEARQNCNTEPTTGQWWWWLLLLLLLLHPVLGSAVSLPLCIFLGDNMLLLDLPWL